MLGAQEAFACGPDYPVETLNSRSVLLESFSRDSFDSLLDDHFKHESPSILLSYVGRNGPKASTLGRGREAQLYRKGADAFNANRPGEAAAAFEALLALPPEERVTHTRSAHYMLGRVHQMGAHLDEAIKHYAKASSLEGDDPLGLALSALGQQARVLLRTAKKKNILKAVDLYREQLTLKHPSAQSSLLYLVRDRNHWPSLQTSTAGRTLLALYFRSRGNEIAKSEHKAMQRRLQNRLQKGQPLSAHWAAYFYVLANFDNAKKVAMTKPDHALSRWVRAKLALRAGDLVEAETLLDGLAKNTGADSCQTSGSTSTHRLNQERSILALARNDKKRAFELLRKTNAGQRLSLSEKYILERLYTLDELKGLVDGATLKSNEACYGSAFREDASDLLARRYFRNAEYQKALPYFSASTKSLAQKYIDGVSKIANTKNGVTRSEEMFKLAEFTRRGSPLFATSHFPDFAKNDTYFHYHQHNKDHKNLCTDQEKRLAQQHAPAYSSRYHYIELATHIIENAADLVHPRSQAYAAMMCRAIDMIQTYDATRRDELYLRYINEGALVDFVMGENCPAPDFESAKHFKMPEPPRKPIRKRYIASMTAAVFALSVAAIIWARRLHRRREHQL